MKPPAVAVGSAVRTGFLSHPGGLTVTRQYVNGPTYIDERVVLRDLTGNGRDRYYLLKDIELAPALPRGGTETENRQRKV